MIKDANMQHMTMTEYVSIAILTESTGSATMRKGIAEGLINEVDVVKEAFEWADLWMKIREERLNNETKKTQPQWVP